MAQDSWLKPHGTWLKSQDWWLMAKKNSVLGPPGLGPSASSSWSWDLSHEPSCISHEPWAMSHEPLTPISHWYSINKRITRFQESKLPGFPWISEVSKIPRFLQNLSFKVYKISERTHVPQFSIFEIVRFHKTFSGMRWAILCIVWVTLYIWIQK